MKNDDPYTLDLLEDKDDPDREFPVGFGEKRLREYGLFDFLQEKEDIEGESMTIQDDSEETFHERWDEELKGESND